MAKIKLGSAPKNFPKLVKFDQLDGTAAEIKITFIYRTRAQFSAFIDESIEAAKAHEREFLQRQKQAASGADADDAATDAPPVSSTTAEIVAASLDRQANYIMKIASGWNLDEEFAFDNVRQMCDECPAASNAITESYRAAIVEGRLGN